MRETRPKMGRAFLSCALALALAPVAVPGASFASDDEAEVEQAAAGASVSREAAAAELSEGEVGSEGEISVEAAIGEPAGEVLPESPDESSQPNDSGESSVPFEEALAQTAGYLARSVPNPTVSSVGGEWAVIGLSRSGNFSPERAQAYYVNVVQKVRETGGVLHRVKYTEYSRVVLALSALGFDPADVDGYNLIAPLADFDQVCWQGVNGPIWALIALDSRGYDIPLAPEGKAQTTRDKLLDAILASEIAGGGWALSGGVPDPDMTAMAVQALAPYRASRADVAAALSRAIDVLSGLQSEDGGYGSWGSANSESCAQVVVALTAMGIDPATDARFVKSASSVVDALLSFSVEGGGFKHVASGSINGMATEQGFYALVAYDRFLAGKTRLYDMSDVSRVEPAPVPDPTPGAPADGADADVPNAGDPAITPPSGADGRAGAPAAGAPSGKTFSLAGASPVDTRGLADSDEDDGSDPVARSQALPALSSADDDAGAPLSDASDAAHGERAGGWVWACVCAIALCAAVGIGVCRRRLRAGAVPAGEADDREAPAEVPPDDAGGQAPKR